MCIIFGRKQVSPTSDKRNVVTKNENKFTGTKIVDKCQSSSAFIFKLDKLPNGKMPNCPVK